MRQFVSLIVFSLALTASLVQAQTSRAASAASYLERGAELDRGNLDRAIADFNRAIELDRRIARAYMNRGLVRLLQGQKSEAQKGFARCIKLRPDLKLQVDQRIVAVNEWLAKNKH